MENKLVVIPKEVEELSLKVSEEKREEVKLVLNNVFSGTSEWKSQVEAIEVKDINDSMSIQLADTARKNAKNARLDAEKIFDAKRADVQSKMQGFKTEDALWLKAKQTMQILFKDIEETAKYKADFVKRYEAEQRELRNQIRYNKLLAFIPDEEISMIEVDSMSDESFTFYLSGIEKQYNDRIEAEKKAEEERKEVERIDKLGRERQAVIYKYMQFQDEIQSVITLGKMTKTDFETLIQTLEIKKQDYDKKQEEIRKENERLKKEREEAEKKRIAEEKVRAEKERKEREAYEAKIKAEREEKERIEREEKVKREKLEAELKAKEEAETKAKADREARLQAELNKGDAEKVKDLIADLQGLKEKYSFKSQKNQKMYQDVKYLLDKIVTHIESK